MRTIVQTIQEIDKKVATYGKKISFFEVNPINLEQEKEAFFKQPNYNPQFKYSVYRENLDNLQKELKALKPDNTVLGKLYKKKIRDFINDINMLKNRGDAKKFTLYATKLYGEPDKELLRAARRFLKGKKRRERKKLLTTKQIIRMMKHAFIKYGISWDVEQKEMAAMAAVKGNKKKLLIKKNARFSKEFVKRLIVHEIGTHIVRVENGLRQPYQMFRQGLPNYLMTEEGLAVVNEELNDCLDPYRLKIYAGRVLAINKALKSSFYDTYKYIRRYFPKETAFTLTMRAKRGLSDTSEPGGLTKDIAYLKGYLEIKKYVKKGGDLNMLYYGKVGLQHVPLLTKIPGLVHPWYLPMMRYMRFLLDHFSDLSKNIVLVGLSPLIMFKPIRTIFQPLLKYLKTKNSFLITLLKIE